MPILALLILMACNNETTSTESSLDTESKESSESVAQSGAVVLWPALVIRETPADKGKYVTSVYQGESLMRYGEIVEDTTNNKNNEYVKVELSDGTEGWVLNRFIAEDGRPAVISTITPLYKRPDLLTKSDKEFKRMDFVAILESSDDWIKIKGVPSGSTWFAEGWIKNDKVTTTEVDVSFAVLANRAMSIENEEEKKAEMKDLLNNADFNSSIFYNDLAEMSAAQEIEEEIIMTSIESDSLIQE